MHEAVYARRTNPLHEAVYAYSVKPMHGVVYDFFGAPAAGCSRPFRGENGALRGEKGRPKLPFMSSNHAPWRPVLRQIACHL